VIAQLTLLNLIIIGYFTGLLFFSLKDNLKAGKILIYLTVFAHLILIILRAIEVKHAPLSGIFESLIFFSLLISLKSTAFLSRKKKIFIIFSYLIVLLMLISSSWMPFESQVGTELMPALNSFWIYIHVPAFFIGYTSAAVAFIYALNFLINRDFSVIHHMDREVQYALFFISVGIITGAMWADTAWGGYWSYDPKENFSLITWLVYLFYFHIRLLSKNIVIKAWTTVIAFSFVLFTYIGVTYLFSGLHSYL